MVWPSRKKMTAKKTINKNCPIPNEGGFRPAGSVVFNGLAIVDSNRLGQFWRGSTGANWRNISIILVDPLVSEAGDSQWTLPRAQPTSLRWRCKCGWEPKSRDFRLFQALANQVVRKGGCGGPRFCSLFSPFRPLFSARRNWSTSIPC